VGDGSGGCARDLLWGIVIWGWGMGADAQTMIDHHQPRISQLTLNTPSSTWTSTLPYVNLPCQPQHVGIAIGIGGRYYVDYVERSEVGDVKF